MKKNNKWFSIILALLITAFLIILSSWILTLVVHETKNTRLVYNAISTQAWIEWVTEYALLKIKNHKEWFADKVTENDFESKLLAKDVDNIWLNEQKIEYEIFNYDFSYTWTIKKWEVEIIPLFYDEWNSISTNNNYKNPNLASSSIIKTKSFKLSWNWTFLWNIIWNNSIWTSFWITWTWVSWKNIWSMYSDLDITNWIQKIMQDDTNINSSFDAKKIKIIYKSIENFLNEYNDNYLIIYSSNSDLDYKIESNEWFSLPKLKIISSSRIRDYRQNLEFNEDKNKFFESLKYSIFTK